MITVAENVSIILASVILAGLLALPRLRHSRLWLATITPLASIVGSGYLVLSPILAQNFGKWTPLAMAGLCALAYAIGAVVRFNITTLARKPHSPASQVMENIASWVLSAAYIVSVSYYLNLLGAFSVSLTQWDSQLAARLVTTCVFVFILALGWSKGFDAFERVETVTVGVNMAIIGGLLVGLAWYNADKIAVGEIVLSGAKTTGFAALSLLFGLVVTVQGFETSRYLEDEFDARTRVRSTRLAQWISTGIYMVYVTLMAYVFPSDQIKTSETAIIQMMAVVAPVLPFMLVGAALAAQFSAAVADTSGAGGLVEVLTKRRVPVKIGYAVLVGLGLVITWGLDVFQIISWASKAFAAYYTVQGAIAVVLARREGKSVAHVAFFAGVTMLAAAVTLLGTAVE